MAAKRRKQSKDDLVVKASILIGVREHALWAACASLRKLDRSAFAVEAIRTACAGLVISDRRKPDDPARVKVSAIDAGPGGRNAPDDAA